MVTWRIGIWCRAFLWIKTLQGAMEQLAQKLPFPISQLTWEKLADVAVALGLPVDEAKVVLRLVLGKPPDGFDTSLIYCKYCIPLSFKIF